MTNEGSMVAAVDNLVKVIGDRGIGPANNAGIITGGPLEFLPLSEIR